MSITYKNKQGQKMSDDVNKYHNEDECSHI